MRTITLNGKEMTSRASAHAYLAKQLSFPDYYGGNLDALHDCLTGIGESTHIIIEHLSEIVLSLGSYGSALLQVLNISAEETDTLTITLRSDAEPCSEIFEEYITGEDLTI